MAVLEDGTTFEPPSESQRQLLALLAIRNGRAVAAETISDLFELSGGAVRTTVSRLRRVLGDVLVTESQGYALHVETDVQHFQSLVASARTAAPAEAAVLRKKAVDLFVGPALEEFSDEPWAMAEVARLGELRSAVVEDLIEDHIAGHRYDDAIDQIHRHVLDHPYRDRPQELLMTALALSGRQVEALRAFQQYRTHLIEEVGVDPGPAICELDRRISVGDFEVPSAEDIGDLARSPAASPDASRSNMHPPPNDFVGRQAELSTIGQALAESRLVTLLGPGGVGKTRLAYRVAAEQIDVFSDGAWVVELVQCRDGADVIRTITGVFGLSDVETVEHCATQLAGHDILLVIDNCEHIVDELFPILDVLLSQTARLRVIATSRVRLGLVGERVVSISPLRTDGEAQDLFVNRAVASGAVFADSDMAAVGAICERLDGIPLALELAAASSRVLSPVELLDRLEDRFAILKGGPRGSVAGRHESLRAAVDSSYESLDDETQRFFRRLAVFAGEFPISAAEAVASDLSESAIDYLIELVDRSLLTMQTENGRSSYRVLETLRQYGADRLHELGEYDAAIEAHIEWCFNSTSQLAIAAFGSSEVASLNEMVASAANLRLAIDRMIDHGDAARAADLVLHLDDFAYASHVLAGLVGPVIESGIAENHHRSRELFAMELVRLATSGSTEKRKELASKLSGSIEYDDPGTIQISVLLISTALGLGPETDLIDRVAERAVEHTNTAERARLLSGVGLGRYYGNDLPEDLDLVETAANAARQAGMKRLTVATASMACIAGLRLERPKLGAELARPYLQDLAELGHASIMSNGLISMYTESAIQAGLAPEDQLAAVRHAGPNLRGDFNKLGQALARLVQHHGEAGLAVRALGACAKDDRSHFSSRQRALILEQAADTLSEREIETLLATGAVSETTDLYREMWAVLAPLMAGD